MITDVLYLILGVIDVKYREFSAIAVWSVLILSAVYALFYRKCDWVEILMTLGLLMFELLVFRLLQGRIGLADVFLSVSLVFVMGIIDGLIAMWLAFVMCGVTGLVAMLIRRKRIMELPMVPFLALAKIIVEVI